MSTFALNSSTTKIWKKLSNISIYLTFFLFIVTPNALRILKLPFLLLLLIIAASNTKIHKNQLIFFILLTAVTYIYILVGYNKTVDFQSASTQSFIVFVIFPIIWITIGNFIFKMYNIDFIVKKYVHLGLLGCLSVYIAYAAFIMGYGSYVKILVERPNAAFYGNVFSITLNVFGSLLFLAAAIGFVSKLYSVRKFILILSIFLFTAFISGRSGFILAAFIGLAFFIVKDKKLLKNSFIIIVGALLIVVILYYSNLQISDSIKHFFDELASGGGTERSKQTKLLGEAILDTYFMGAGHGVGIEYIRNYEFPWRYENLIFSLLYRVGIIGFLVYAYPYIYTILAFLKLKSAKQANIYDHFFFWGSSVFLLINFTNPYMESFEFQIPYFFTYCYFLNRYRIQSNESTYSSKIRS